MGSDYAKRALEYARGVVSGRISACRYIRLACQRHISDLKQQRKKDFRYRFDEAAAGRVCQFIEALPHTKGKWGAQAELIKLGEWQVFALAVGFGWLQKKDRLRRYREIYIEVPRKNGKSIIAAGIGLYMLAADGEYGAEVYSGATTEKQAWEVFRPARLMAARTPELCEYYGISVNASNINIVEDASRFEPVVGNPGDGASPSCAIADEVHEHRDSSLIDTMLTGMGAREHPVMLYITTAGADIESPAYHKRQALIDVLDGTAQDDRLFGLIYTIDPEDDWTTDDALRKANPNYGVSVFPDYLEAQRTRALNTARFVNSFKTKHLNVWVSAKEAFFDMEKWKAAEDKTLTAEQFAGEDCYLGFDLASKLDLTAMVKVVVRRIPETDDEGRIKEREHYYVIAPKFWVPEDTVFSGESRRLSEIYQGFHARGYLLLSDGAEIDYRDIELEAIDAGKDGNVVESAIDPHGATALTHRLDDAGLNPVTVTQNYTQMSAPLLELEAAIMSGRIHHDGNPVLTWCISNVVAKFLPGSDDVCRPIKERAEAKIDGAVALIMAIGRSIAARAGGGAYHGIYS